MNNTKYEQLKQVIQKANPEIMELKFGCEVLSGKTKFEFIYGEPDDYVIYNENFGASGNATIIDKVLGRPIRLADVLLAIEKVESEDIMLTYWLNGKSFVVKWEEEMIWWNLKDDNLDNQSEETKQFLIDLLCKD